MNFLAHLHLAEPTPESRLGSLLGDFVRGYPWDDRYSVPIWAGIVEHRFVDAFTDGHPAWQRSRDLLPPEMRRFAGIVVDIFYDYFLHRHWTTFSPEQSLDEFVDSVHGQLAGVLPAAPAGAVEAIEAMISQEWLREYATLDGIDLTLRRVSSRSPVLAPIFGGVGILEGNLDALEAHFLAFYPDLIAYVSEVRAAIRQRGSASRANMWRRA